MAVTAKASDSSRSGVIRLNGAHKGVIGKALARSLAEARQAGTVPDSSVVATLAERMAGVADAAWRADDFRTFMSASQKLLALSRALGLVNFSLPVGGADDDGDGDDAGGDVLDRELADIVGSGPALRNTKNS